MVVKILGILDIYAVFILLCIIFEIEIPIGFLIAASVFLVLKACIAILDIGSLIDLAAAVLITLSFFIHLPLWLLLVGVGLLGIKGIISLFS